MTNYGNSFSQMQLNVATCGFKDLFCSATCHFDMDKRGGDCGRQDSTRVLDMTGRAELSTRMDTQQPMICFGGIGEETTRNKLRHSSYKKRLYSANANKIEQQKKVTHSNMHFNAHTLPLSHTHTHTNTHTHTHTATSEVNGFSTYCTISTSGDAHYQVPSLCSFLGPFTSSSRLDRKSTRLNSSHL